MIKIGLFYVQYQAVGKKPKVADFILKILFGLNDFHVWIG